MEVLVNLKDAGSIERSEECRKIVCSWMLAS